MSCQTIFRRGYFKIVLSFCKHHKYYYTVVNTKKNIHCHVHKTNLSAARMICLRAYQSVIPERYPEWMKEAIRRIL